MNILVTGGAGFIGCNFIRYWMDRHPGDRVICVDKLTYAGRLENLGDVLSRRNFRFVKSDICDSRAMESLFREERPKIVVNFAAESHVDRSIEDPSVFLKSNILGTSVLMDCCRKSGARFHQVSTDEVYGDLPLSEGNPFTEVSLIRPSSPYAASKASADFLVLSYHRTYGIPVTITRCSNNYGPCQYPEKLIPLTVSRALRDEEIPLYGDGKNVRDWIHVLDHCRAIEMVLMHGKIGEIYNVGGHSEISNVEIVRKILHVLGKPENLISYVKDRPGHDRRYAMDSGKIQNQLGWKAEIPFERGLRETVEWYRKYFQG